MLICPVPYHRIVLFPGAVKVILFNISLGDNVLSQRLQLGPARVLLVSTTDFKLRLDLHRKVVRMVLGHGLVDLKIKE